MSAQFTNVYVPVGAGVYPGHVKHEVLGTQQGHNTGITTSSLRPNIPGVKLHQTTAVNGILVDTTTPGIIR